MCEGNDAPAEPHQPTDCPQGQLRCAGPKSIGHSEELRRNAEYECRRAVHRDGKRRVQTAILKVTRNGTSEWARDGPCGGPENLCVPFGVLVEPRVRNRIRAQREYEKEAREYNRVESRQGLHRPLSLWVATAQPVRHQYTQCASPSLDKSRFRCYCLVVGKITKESDHERSLPGAGRSDTSKDS